MSDHYDRYNGMENLLGTNLAGVGTDCISRQALLDKFEPWLKVKDYNDGELNMLKAVLYEIRFMRPAQPELKKGKWIRNGWAITCSECGYDMPYTVRRFCPNCGANMREVATISVMMSVKNLFIVYIYKLLLRGYEDS